MYLSYVRMERTDEQNEHKDPTEIFRCYIFQIIEILVDFCCFITFIICLYN